MIWRTLIALLCGYLLFVAYRFYAHSQPVTAIDIRQKHIAQTDTVELAVVWPDGPDKAGYVQAVRLMVEHMNQQGVGRCQAAELQLPSEQSMHCQNKKLVMRQYSEVTGDQQDIVAQARTVVGNKNTLAVIGYYRSDSAIPAATVFEHHGVLMLSSAATNAKFTSYDFRHIFRHAADDNSNAEIVADFIREQGYINVYVMYERDLYGTDFSNYFIEHVIAKGLKVPHQVFYEEHLEDFLPMLSSIRSKISPINLTDELALLQAKLEQIRRMERIRQLAMGADDQHIVQFLVDEQQEKNSHNKFFDSMPRVKLLEYLQQELLQSASSSYLQLIFQRNQQELSLLSSATQYGQLDQLLFEIEQELNEIESARNRVITPISAASMPINERIVTRKAIDFSTDDSAPSLKQMLKRIERIKSGNVDALFVAGFMPEVEKAILQARSLNINLPIFGGHTLIDLYNHCTRQNNCARYGEVYGLVTHDTNEYQQVYQALKQGVEPRDSCEGTSTLCLPTRYACPHFETAYTKFQQFAETYQQHYNELPDNWAVQGYLAASIIQQTIMTAHTFDPGVIADTLLYQGNSEFTDKGLMFSCNSLGITEGDVLVEEMKIRKLGDLQVSN